MDSCCDLVVSLTHQLVPQSWNRSGRILQGHADLDHLPSRKWLDILFHLFPRASSGICDLILPSLWRLTDVWSRTRHDACYWIFFCFFFFLIHVAFVDSTRLQAIPLSLLYMRDWQRSTAVAFFDFNSRTGYEIECTLPMYPELDCFPLIAWTRSGIHGTHHAPLCFTCVWDHFLRKISVYKSELI